MTTKKSDRKRSDCLVREVIRPNQASYVGSVTDWRGRNNLNISHIQVIFQPYNSGEGLWTEGTTASC